MRCAQKMLLSEVEIFKAERDILLSAADTRIQITFKLGEFIHFQVIRLRKKRTIIQQSNVFASLMNLFAVWVFMFLPGFYCLSNPS